MYACVYACILKYSAVSSGTAFYCSIYTTV